MAIDFNGRNIWAGTDGAPVTTYHIDSDRRDIDVSAEIPMLMPEATPYLTILMRARKDPVNSLEFIWYDEDAPTWYTKLTASYTDVDTTISVEDASFIRPKDLIKNTATGEIMFVESKSGNSLTVIRGYGYDADAGTGTQAAASVGTNDYIMRLGSAMEENSLAPETHATQPIKNFNYIQTFRTAFDSSMDNELEAKKTSESTRTRLRKLKAIEHRLEIERQLMFGERREDIANKRRTTGGLLQFIKDNAYDVSQTNGGVLTEAEWENYCEMAFAWGSKTKLFVTSPRVGSIINQFAAGRIETTSGDETYGMRLRRYISFHGDVIIATTRLFEKDYAGIGVMIDIENIDYRPYAGYDTKLRTNIQENDRDGWKDEYMTKAGLRVRLQKTHALLTGVQS